MGCTSLSVPFRGPYHNFFAYDARAPLPPLSLAWPGVQQNYRIGDPILHIELRRWADIVLIAPCSANTLAKIATGICDNLVVSLPPLQSQFPLPPNIHPSIQPRKKNPT